MSQVITIPSKTVEVELKDDKTETRRAFIHLAGVVVENTAQKTDTETTLAHQIREKLDAVKDADTTMLLDEAEIEFMQSGIKKLRETDKVVGSLWYYITSSLRDSLDEKQYKKMHSREEAAVSVAEDK